MSTADSDDEPPQIASASPRRAPCEGISLTAASFLRRCLATLVDMVIFVLVSTPLMLPVVSSVKWNEAVHQIDRLARDVSNPAWLNHATSIIGLWMALWWCYFVVGWGLVGATPGKWLLGLRVIDHRGCLPIGAGRAVLRLAAYTVSSMTLCAGHLLVLFRADRRALHDILAGTRVVVWKRQSVKHD